MEAKKETRLVSLRVRDKNEWSTTERGRDYEVEANVVLSGQPVELKSVPIPPEMAMQIIALVERAAVTQIEEAMSSAREQLQARLSGNNPALIESAPNSAN